MDDPLYKLPEEKVELTADDVRSIVAEMMTNFNIPTKMSGAFIQSAGFVLGSSGWRILANGDAEFNNGNFRGDITGATGTFSGTVNINSLNIPDATTANSFHIDSAGNAWWGVNVASGYAMANAYVLKDGTAVFKSVSIGGTGLTYYVTDRGMASYGDGADSNATCDGSTSVTGMSLAGSTYTLTRDVYFDTLNIIGNTTVDPNGYRIFCKTALNVGDGSGTGVISGNGKAGGAAGAGADGITNTTGTVAGGTAGAAGVALPDGYLKGSLVGKVGGAGGQGSSGNGALAGSDGNAGSNTSNSLGSNGVAAGGAGTGGTSSSSNPGRIGGTSQNGGTVTTSNVRLVVGVQLAYLLDVTSTGATLKYDNSASSGSAGGGGGAAGNGVGGPATGIGGAGGGGGGSGSSGRIVAIYAKQIIVAVNGSITSNGGVGGAGGKGGNGGSFGGGQSGNGGGGGGGGGGNGGILILAYNSLTNNGTISASGGTGGAGGNAGTGGISGSNGSAGTNGNTGTIYQFNLSL